MERVVSEDDDDRRDAFSREAVKAEAPGRLARMARPVKGIILR
jgi:hypothetical protein